MPGQRRLRIPKLTRHKSGAARVRIKGQDVWCGRYGTPESEEKYRQTIAEYFRTVEAPAARPVVASDDSLTINEVVLRYWQEHVTTYYRKNGKPTTEVGCFKSALKVLTEHYGTLPIADFTPAKLREVRGVMIRKKVAGGREWTRKTANHQVGRIRRMVRWAVAHELVAPAVLQALEAVEPLKKGRTDARENQKVPPVPLRDLLGAYRHLPPVLRDMVSFQLRTGCRPGEACDLRPGDLTRSGDVWFYVPGSHKTEHHDRARRIPIGRKAQRAILPYLKRRRDAHCFSPREATEQRRAAKAATRKTPLSCGNRRGSNRREKPKKVPGEKWTTGSYDRAIDRACQKAGVPSWNPNQLRHNRATWVRKWFGLEGSQVVLGQANAKVTEIYAERDNAKAVTIAAKLG